MPALLREDNQAEKIPEVNSTFLDKILCRIRANQAIKYIENGDVILDAGCGDKPYLYFHLKRMKKKGIKYFGIDQNIESKNDADLKILVHDFTKPNALPFDDSCFDKVILLAVIEHLDNIDQICREFYRVLKGGGLLVATTPTRRAKKIWELLTKLKVINPLGIDDHKRYYESEEVVKVLIQAGFEKGNIKVSEFEFGYNMLVVARK